MSFEVIPAIDLKSCKCVQLVQGKIESEIISIDNPIEVASNFIENGARTLHLIDLDGAFKGVQENALIIEDIIDNCRSDVSIQIGGGIRSLENVEYLLDIGANKVILSTAAMENPYLIKELAFAFGSECIIVALDAKDGNISIKGWTENTGITPIEMGKKFEELGAGSLLFTNIDSEGLMQGITTKPTKELVESVKIPVIASGGVTTIDDIISFKEIGAKGVVIGSALYTNKFSLENAINAIK
ncbi:MAG: 1-(5-phosphoribosyl)-5-[(5-phosphoribosylamino)methylideneamino]imidazole-4-carboxamide isomerase [Methanosarcinales archaeon]|jgi:phosphoribosylformimino-5-aminoimidazole carboxamide ribotide isomerase|nr:1-(5-phosphoribosyl)-5-[(5-phosphoribosylamino)methylideneamino]imidazole-4-carboxamide isomerase [Methanosarcinales archaeon]